MTSKTAQLALAALALAMSARLAAAEPPQPREKLYPLSRDEVNLVRVPGEMIEHAVYDTDALEVSPDKARGVLYVRVTPAYAASGKKRTAAFVSTQKSSYALALAIEPVGAQEISVQPSQSDLARRSEEKAAEQNTNIASAAAAPMAPLASSDFVGELKTLLKAAAQPAARSGRRAKEARCAPYRAAERNARFRGKARRRAAGAEHDGRAACPRLEALCARSGSGPCRCRRHQAPCPRRRNARLSHPRQDRSRQKRPHPPGT